jgi:Putative serine esterase (DUF676)
MKSQRRPLFRYSFCILYLAFCIFFAIGCGTTDRINPSFSVSTEEAQQILENESTHPKPLERPLVIVGGFFDPGIAAPIMSGHFRDWTHDQRIVAVSLGFCFTIEQCRRHIIEEVDRAFPTNDPNATTEVDVIGYSLGGLASRYASEDPKPGMQPQRRLRIVRLFTISSPLRGAIATSSVPLIGVMPLVQTMTPGSDVIQAVAVPHGADEIYPVYSYIRLRDYEVGSANAALPGQSAWWVQGPPLLGPHSRAFTDYRILADILLRLHDEPPLSTEPPAPLPGPTPERPILNS